jgi:hypothetical protein
VSVREALEPIRAEERRILLREVRRVAGVVRELAEKEEARVRRENDSADLDFSVTASLGLVCALRDAGIPAELGGGRFSGFRHWWVDVLVPGWTEPLIVDIAATQFCASWTGVQLVRPDAKRRERYRSETDSLERTLAAFAQRCIVLSLVSDDWWKGPGSEERTGGDDGAVERILAAVAPGGAK